LYDVGESAGAGKMHCIHVHFCEEWCRCCNSQQDDNLSDLSDLAEVAHTHIPGYISAHKQPPISLHDKRVHCIEAAVSHVASAKPGFAI